MSSKISDKEITEFVRKVRSELRSLPADAMNELTESLEVDLLERREEEGDQFKLGIASTYATQLAEAAGFSFPSGEASRMNLEFLRIWNKALAYFRTLTPAWAIVRGWLLFALAYSPIAYGGIRAVPIDFRDWFVIAVLVALSVWVSLKKFVSLHIPLIVVNTLLMIGGFYVTALISNAIDEYRDYKIQALSGQMSVGGHPVMSACGYDQNGYNLGALSMIKDTNGNVIFTDVNANLDNCRPQN